MSLISDKGNFLKNINPFLFIVSTEEPTNAMHLTMEIYTDG